MDDINRLALEYHRRGRPGKIEVQPSKSVATPRDLSLAYSPGVAAPCLEIARDPDLAFEYTTRGNLVAVISNGTAVLGLGDIGPLASKPVMEGKGVLFKRFADIDVFDLEVEAETTEQFMATVRSLQPTFGGINLEDIAAPQCFEIERTLQDQMDIPVFHDDQHGTAIIASAALYNAMEVVGKSLETISIVVNGAGAAGIATAELLTSMGVPRAHITLCDSSGVIFEGRQKGMNAYKQAFAHPSERRTLAEALDGADVFIGVSVAGVVTPDMVRSMAADPIVFALANPDPEITWEDAYGARPDVIMATGRSDYPNQVNNVLGFPFIFRGALDVRARKVNDAMKIAAVRAIADLARQEVPDTIRNAYDKPDMRFGREYLIPKPLDNRVLLWVAPAVARAAVESGVARKPITDWDAYQLKLERLLGRTRQIMRPLIARARLDPKRIVFPEGGRTKVLRAARNLALDGICRPILLADRRELEYTLLKNQLDLPDTVTVIDPHEHERLAVYEEQLWMDRRRKGVTRREAGELLRNRNYFGMMMVRCGDADGVVTGFSANYAEAVRPAMQILGPSRGMRTVSGAYVLVLRERLLFVGDCTVNIEPTSEQLADIAINTARVARSFGIEPKAAMLSFSNFGSTRHPQSRRVRQALKILSDRGVDFEVDGEMQADVAFDQELRAEVWPFCRLTDEPNVLIFPDLQSGNIAYKLLTQLAGATAIGPLLVGMDAPVNILQLGSDVAAIENLATITAAKAALGAL